MFTCSLVVLGNNVQLILQILVHVSHPDAGRLS